MASGEGGVQALGQGGQADSRRDDQSIARIELIAVIAIRELGHCSSR